MNAKKVKMKSEITRSNTRLAQDMTIGSWTLVTSLVPVSPLVPKHINPWIHKVHRCSRLVEAIKVCFHVAELQVSRMPLLNPIVDRLGNFVEAVGVIGEVDDRIWGF
jgi:hypothetical protein